MKMTLLGRTILETFNNRGTISIPFIIHFPSYFCQTISFERKIITLVTYFWNSFAKERGDKKNKTTKKVSKVFIRAFRRILHGD